ncbi:DegT/DnrJ/EryC1/StrS family aminotransferase [Cohnella sp. GCM10020058]|uniref:DegT/DnrJ/EryC1/StrS family aminotransferase n=1 Tax=Cohnella sp. GCM10020058 TaxID=3317330 RepID=UPI0036381DAA
MRKLAIHGGAAVGALNVPAWPIFGERELELVTDVVSSGNWGFLGPKEQEFEALFARFCGAGYGVAVANGTVSLKLALEALGIGPGDEVIVPGMTWQATATAVLDVNAVPVLVDAEPDTYTIDPRAIEAAITTRTRAIIPVHLYGRIADMDAIMRLADRYRLHVVEDCAHQHGSEWKGRPVGSIGSVGSFSFQSSKIINAGEGGFLTTNSGKLSDLMQSLKMCGRDARAGAPVMHSGNYRMTEFQAAILIAQLGRLEAQNAERDRNAIELERALSELPGLRPLYRSPNITKQSYYCLTIRYDREAWDGIPKDAFMAALVAELEGTLNCSNVYEPLNASPFYNPRNKNTHKLSDAYWRAIDPSRFELPVSERAFAEEAINFSHTMLLLGAADRRKIADAAGKIFEHRHELREAAQSRYSTSERLSEVV